MKNIDISNPGPWRVEYDQPYCATLVDANGNKVKGITLWLDDAPVPDFNAVASENFKMAALGPSAKLMLTTLKTIIKEVDDDGMGGWLLELVDETIRKVEGK